MFSHRLRYLVDAIAQEKGLSSTRQFGIITDVPKLVNEHVAIPDAGLDTIVGDGLSNPSDRSSESVQTQDSLYAQGDRYLNSKAQASTDNPGPNFMEEESNLNAAPTGYQSQTVELPSYPLIPEKAAMKHIGGHSEPLLVEEGPSSHFVDPVGRLQPEQSEEPTIDQEDFIDYKDYEEPNQTTPSESSTLHEDRFNVITDTLHPGWKDEIISRDEEAPQDSQDLADSIVEGKELIHSIFYDKSNRTALETRLDDEFSYPTSSGKRLLSLPNKKIVNGGNLADTLVRDRLPVSSVDHDSKADQVLPSQPDVLHLPKYQGSTTYDATSQTIDPDREDIESRRSSNLFSAENGTAASSHHWTEKVENQVQEKTDSEEVQATSLISTSDFINETSPEEVVEPHILSDVKAQNNEDNDEITYEDEDDYEKSIGITVFPAANFNVSATPGSLKHARSFDEDDEPSNDFQGTH